jgi:hypothetical protein
MSTGRSGQQNRRRTTYRWQPILSTLQNEGNDDNKQINSLSVSPLQQRRLYDDDTFDGHGYEEEEDDDSIVDTCRKYVNLLDTLDLQCDGKLKTSDSVEESNMQVRFCEITAQEMKQILTWWATQVGNNADDEVDKEDFDDAQPQNSLNLPDDPRDDVAAYLLNTSLAPGTPSSSLLGGSDYMTQCPRGSSSTLFLEQPRPHTVNFFSPTVKDFSFLSARDDEVLVCLTSALVNISTPPWATLTSGPESTTTKSRSCCFERKTWPRRLGLSLNLLEPKKKQETVMMRTTTAFRRMMRLYHRLSLFSSLLVA